MADKYDQKWTLWFRPDRDWKTNAVTVGQTAYYSCPQAEVTASWRRHEDKHKEQWRRDGWLFAVKYSWYHLRYGYQKNPYEIEARQAEKETA